MPKCPPLTGLAVTLLVASQAAAQITINEIRTDDPGIDDAEHVELKGPPNLTLTGYTYIVIGDGPGGNFGFLEEVLDLASFWTYEDGLVDIASNDSLDTASFPICGGDWTVFATKNLNFENNDNVTHMIVEGFTGTVNTDLDTDDDGVLDIVPWTRIVDSVALIDTPGAGDLVYSTTQVGPDPVTGGQPAHVYWCDGGGWQIGVFDPECLTDSAGEPNNCSPTTAVQASLEQESWGRVKAYYR